MVSIKVNTHINGTPEKVFDVFTDFENATQNLSGVEKIEVITDGPVGVGTRFRETRIMFKKAHTEEMEVSVFEPGKRFEVKAGGCGCEYLTSFNFNPSGSGTSVDVEMKITPVTFFAKVMSPLARLMSGSMKKCFQKDFDDLKSVVEAD